MLSPSGGRVVITQMLVAGQGHRDSDDKALGWAVGGERSTQQVGSPPKEDVGVGGHLDRHIL